MAVKGLKIEKDSKGHPRKAIFNMDTHGGILEDIIDNLIVDSKINEEEVGWDIVKAREDKRRKFHKKQ